MGRQIRSFDKATVQLLRDELQKAVQQVVEDYGVSVTVGYAKYGMNQITYQLVVNVVAENGQPITREAEHFQKFAEVYGLQPTDLYDTFEYQGLEYRIIGMNLSRNAKYRIETVCESKGKNVRFTAEAVKRVLEEKREKENQTTPKPRLNRRGR